MGQQQLLLIILGIIIVGEQLLSVLIYLQQTQLKQNEIMLQTILYILQVKPKGITKHPLQWAEVQVNLQDGKFQKS